MSNRKLLQHVFEKFQLYGDSFTSACILIDKLDKLEKSKIYAELQILGISIEQIGQLIQFLDSKTILEAGEKLGKDNAGVVELEEFFNLCNAYGIGDWVTFDPKIVRYFYHLFFFLLFCY